MGIMCYQLERCSTILSKLGQRLRIEPPLDVLVLFCFLLVLHFYSLRVLLVAGDIPWRQRGG